MERELFAYLLIAAMVLALGAWIMYARRNSHQRQYRRSQRRDRARYEKRMAKK